MMRKSSELKYLTTLCESMSKRKKDVVLIESNANSHLKIIIYKFIKL